MCGRFVIKLSPEMMAAIYALQNGLSFESYNVAPTNEVPVIWQRGNAREAQLQRFGFIPFYAKHPKDGVRSLNVRIETIGEKAPFKKALQDHRCVIPANGFYEWADGAVKQPYYFSPSNAPLLSFAGIWSHKKFGEEDYLSFAILTTTPHPAVEKFHDRSPLLLGEDIIDRWLDNRPVEQSFLDEAVSQSHAVPLSAWSVDRRIGNVRNNDAKLIEPMQAELALFAPPEARVD